MVVPRTVEKQAETVEEAVALAKAELGVSADQEVTVEVLENANPGFFFGFGSKKARVRVSLGETREKKKPRARAAAPARETEAEPQAREAGEQPAERREISDQDKEFIRDLVARFLNELADKLGVELRKEIILRNGTLFVNIDGEDVASLIGRKGQTLSSIQYLLSVMISRRVEGKIDVALDISGYRARRRSSLERMARDAARQAERTGREVAMEPMDAAERKIIHMAIRSIDGVETTSVGEGPDRKVLVVPSRRDGSDREDKGGRGRRRPRRRRPRAASSNTNDEMTNGEVMEGRAQEDYRDSSEMAGE